MTIKEGEIVIEDEEAHEDINEENDESEEFSEEDPTHISLVTRGALNTHIKEECNETGKKMMVVGRAENFGERWSFRSHTTHKGRPRAGMPQISSPTFSHPERTCKETKMVRKKEREQKTDRTPAKPNRTNRRRKPQFHTTNVIPEPFTHIWSRF